jgi:uncharacterized secreted protein with C-terminal beta-propeller domain
MRRLIVLGLALGLAGCEANIDRGVKEIRPLLKFDGQTVATPKLSTFPSCKLLKERLREKTSRHVREMMANWPVDPPRYLFMPERSIGGAFDMAPGSVAASPMASMEGIDFSGTNNQEKGVDEADIIKIDGQYFYILNKNQLEILKIQDDGSLENVSRLALSEPARGLLLFGDRAVLLTEIWQRDTKLRIDWVELGADRTKPEITKSYYFQGSLSAARKIGEKLHVATLYNDELRGIQYFPVLPEDYYDKSDDDQAHMWAHAVSEARRANEAFLANHDFVKLVPRQLHKHGELYIPYDITEKDCDRVYGSFEDDARGFVSLITLAADSNEITENWVRGSSPVVYASPEQVIIAERKYPSWEDIRSDRPSHNSWPSTSIHRFKLDGGMNPRYADSLEVPGTMLNSFSLSEYNGYVRLATTIRVFGPEGVDQNRLFILGEKDNRFQVVSSIENIAPGETIWSARFTKDKGFLVTFKQVDPLFTLDLSDPLHPFVAGSLKVPGVSTYMQDIGGGRLLAVGYGGTEEGLNWQTSISLFDTSDFSNPALIDSLSLKEEGLDNNWFFQSAANHDHLAVNYFAPAGLTAIPLFASHMEWDQENHKLISEYRSKLKIVNTKNGEEFKLLGEIDHSMMGQEKEHRDPEIRRSYFVGNYLYAFSSGAITSTRLSDFATIASIMLD